MLFRSRLGRGVVAALLIGGSPSWLGSQSSSCSHGTDTVTTTTSSGNTMTTQVTTSTETSGSGTTTIYKDNGGNVIKSQTDDSWGSTIMEYDIAPMSGVNYNDVRHRRIEFADSESGIGGGDHTIYGSSNDTDASSAKNAAQTCKQHCG